MITKRVIVAGHICLDVTPDLSSVPEGQFNALLQPGRMIRTGDIIVRTGGAVANTGLALHRLGVPVQLIGKIGDDLFGRTIQSVMGEVAPQLVDDLVVDPSTSTSFTIVLNPPGFDRTFLHSPGANDTFYASDIPRTKLQLADLFHFGYPSLMRSVYRGNGAELVSIMQRARRQGLTTSLDFSLPDPTSPAGKVDWRIILANSLPYVDLFVPSVEELIFLLQRETFDRLCSNAETPFLEAITPDMLHDLSETVLGYGVKAVLIKLGHQGIYLRTAPADTWKKGGRALDGLPGDWFSRELWAPAFKVDVCGTTGAGDAAIAGFLSSILGGTDPETALVMAAAAGACSVECADSTSGLLTWEETLVRVNGGWETLPLTLGDDGWQKEEMHDLWRKN
jgi:sugar/nucleoside kinase (ribokinase family)